MDKLDLKSFNKAILSLKDALEKLEQNPLDLYVRDSVIQRFEYTYEISWKMIKRFLELNSPTSDNVETLSFPNLIRTANEQQLLLGNWTNWKEYRDARNITSHTYDEDKALKVVEVAKLFLPEAETIYKNLQSRLAEID